MLNYTPNVANDWKNALSFALKEGGYLNERVITSMSPSQLESKMWMVEMMLELAVPCKLVAILGGWFAQYTIPLLVDNFNSNIIYNYEMDPDVKTVSYKFNKRYKESKQYVCQIHNVMFESIEYNISAISGGYDTIINTSCEHMFPMRKFRELNKNNSIYVLQSSNDRQYDDHINCVDSADELSDQANIVDVMYSGELELSNGMTRYMVIGR